MKKSFTLAEMSGCVNEVVGYVFIPRSSSDIR